MAEFDVVLEVDTDSLTEEAYRVGSFSGTVTLLVEAQARTWWLAALVWSSSQSLQQLSVTCTGPCQWHLLHCQPIFLTEVGN